MKKVSLLFVSLAVAIVCGAKDIKTVVLNTTPEMHCSGCENRIKSNIRFEKGIKNIETNLENKTVTIEYDADKTSVEEIINGFKIFMPERPPRVDSIKTMLGSLSANG